MLRNANSIEFRPNSFKMQLSMNYRVFRLVLQILLVLFSGIATMDKLNAQNNSSPVYRVDPFWPKPEPGPTPHLGIRSSQGGFKGPVPEARSEGKEK